VSGKDASVGGWAGWLLARLRSGGRRRPRLELVERIALAPRQSLSLVEAEGRRFLVVTSPEGSPAFYALDERPMRTRNNNNVVRIDGPARQTAKLAASSADDAGSGCGAIAPVDEGGPDSLGAAADRYGSAELSAESAADADEFAGAVVDTQSSNLVSGQLQVADSALGSVVTNLTQAISLATRANNGTLDGSDVKSIANQIAGILNEVQSLANTSYQGQYIFAGGQTSTSPFATSTASSPSVTTYNGDQDVNYLESPNGQKIQLNVPGDQIFMGTGANSVFGALNSLVADYASGEVDTGQAVKDTTALGTALGYVSQQRVILDNSMTQITAASEAVTNVQTQLTSAQTDLMQADIPTVSTQLSLNETQQTALEDVIAQLNSTSNSLFSKLPA